MKFRPLHDRVVVERIDADVKSAGGILIPDSAQEKPSQGEIVAVGPGGRDEAGKLIPIDLKKGDRVLFGKWSGTEVKIDGQDLLIMKESDIMGVLQSAPIIETGIQGVGKCLPRKLDSRSTLATECCVGSTFSTMR
jgi:chaperonin GroES